MGGRGVAVWGTALVGLAAAAPLAADPNAHAPSSLPAAPHSFPAPPSPPPASARIVLLGDWYVLVHFREVSDAPADSMQWDDEVWRIEADGSGLRWLIFPHPEFRDASGRWEVLAGGEEARSLGAWAPSPEQQREIARGLRSSGQDERAKRLRSSPSGGWASAGALRAVSVSQIGYHERWRIQEAPAGPIFIQEAEMGSGRTQLSRGDTRFRTRAVSGGGDELTGDYLREGEGEGVFRMLRMGDSSPRKIHR